MAAGFLPPMLQVLEDERVAPGEIGWLTQELLLVITLGVMMAAFWELVEEGVEW